MDEDHIKRVCAETICKVKGIDPNALEPGDAYGVDGYMRNGDPAHFMWREFFDHPEVAFLAEWVNQAIMSEKLNGKEFNAFLVPKPIRLSAFQRDVLRRLFEDEKREFYSSLNNIAINLQCEKNRVRLACRALKRKGLAKQVSWFDTDDGHICGSGYGITPAGIAYAEKQGWKGGDE